MKNKDDFDSIDLIGFALIAFMLIIFLLFITGFVFDMKYFFGIPLVCKNAHGSIWNKYIVGKC